MKQVILTFDDRVASQLEAVALLKEYGFGATFYINRFEEKRPEAEERPLMTAAELRQLAGAGFELGNHSVNHPDFSTLDDAEIEREIDGMERMFAAAGLPKPVTFAYPGGPFCERAAALLRGRGYLAARTNEHRGYDPETDSVMRIPAFPVANKYPGIFREAVAAGQEGRVIVLIYHGIPDAALHCSTAFAEFKMQMKYLKEERYRVTGLAEFLRR